MREIRSYGSVGVSAGNRRHYPALGFGLKSAVLLGKSTILVAAIGNEWLFRMRNEELGIVV